MMNRVSLGIALGLALVTKCLAAGAQEAWQPAQGPLKTRWAKDVSPRNAHPEYPRPQMARADWLNLNGLWDYAITPKEAARPERFEGRILVPFPVESALSGVRKTVTEKDRIWYRRAFQAPEEWAGRRVLLHFGAVDFEAEVWVNNQSVGRHRGGYDAFTFDITAALKAPEQNELLVAVWDPTDAAPYARGKQVRRPDRGIFYTAASGIWQTVWLEPVPAAHIAKLKLAPDIDAGALRLTVTTEGTADEHAIAAVASAGGAAVAQAAGKPGREFSLPINNPRLWSPDDPFLYDLTVTLRRGEKTVDSVAAYFGMRKTALGKDEKGVTRILLNNKPFFLLGPLDQGFWPDGIYTAPTDEALRYDIQITKQLGFNGARKHVKVEPERWYYWADKLGLAVWQDMPSGDRFIGGNDPDLKRTPESAQQFESELKAMIETRYNHPAILMWVVFNEGWGQYDTPRLVSWVKELDPTRLANNASGWTDRGVGDVNDMHNYPGPGSPKPEANRAAVLGEFGGLGFRVAGHTWAESTWGYRGMASVEGLTRRYARLLRGVWALQESPGLCAAIYTQTTDVEYEGNGLLTYDREIIKMPADTLAAINRRQLAELPPPTVVVPTAQAEAILWRYTIDKPGDEWFKRDFDAAAWNEGPGGFGTQGTPGAVVRTEWKSGDLWLRRQFTLPEDKLDGLFLLMHHDEDAQVYLNGVLAARARGFTTDYDEFEISPEARAALKPGPNTIAVHCRQTGGGQYIDAGLARYAK